jgi:hypothetical protein
MKMSKFISKYRRALLRSLLSQLHWKMAVFGRSLLVLFATMQKNLPSSLGIILNMSNSLRAITHMREIPPLSPIYIEYNSYVLFCDTTKCLPSKLLPIYISAVYAIIRSYSQPLKHTYIFIHIEYKSCVLFCDTT